MKLQTEAESLLLQLSDEFLLVVQLVSQAADLFLVSFTVGVNLLLHRFLNTHKNTIYTFDRVSYNNTLKAGINCFYWCLYIFCGC